MDIYKIQRVTTVLMLGIILSAALEPVEAITPAQSPLFLGVIAAKPNIMLLVDNSMSMGSTNPITVPGGTTLTPDMVTGSSTTCSHYLSGGASTAPGATTVITMQVFSNKAKFCPSTGTCTNNNSTSFGDSSLKKCFDITKFYNIGGLGIYPGDQLNQYFNKYNGFLIDLTTSLPTTTTRLQIVQKAAKSFVEALVPVTGELPTIRLGLSRYNSSATGGELLVAIGDLDAAKATTIKTKIDTFTANSNTPLAQSLSDIGHYFTSGVGLNSWTTSTGYPDTSSAPSLIW